VPSDLDDSICRYLYLTSANRVTDESTLDCRRNAGLFSATATLPLFAVPGTGPLNVAASQNHGILIVGADFLNISEVNGVLEYTQVNHWLHIRTVGAVSSRNQQVRFVVPIGLLKHPEVF
jgi:hypothetical protein